MVKAKRLRTEAAARQAVAAPWQAPDGARLAKAKQRDGSSSRPQLARAELLDKPTRIRFEEEIDAALRAAGPPASSLARA